MGYEDDLNLYAYVRNDPLNLMDPTGRCAEQTMSDGSTRMVGVCGTSRETGALVQSMLDDPRSSLNAVEQEAIEKGVLIAVTTGTTDTEGNSIGGSNNAAATNSGRNRTTGQQTIVVTVDVTVRAEVDGTDSVTGRRMEPRLQEDRDTIEHEVGGHARDIINGRSSDEQGAIDVENRYRANRGDRFRRQQDTRHGQGNMSGRVVPRSPGVLDPPQ